MKKLKPKVLRKKTPTQEEVAAIKRNPIYLILDEIWDTYNIGSLFRLADAIAAEKIYLCGDMESPPNSRIHKAAVGTENWVPWEKRGSARQVVKELKQIGTKIIAVEQSPNAISYKDLVSSSRTSPRDPGSLTFPVAIIAGHETKGISKEVLKEVDQIVEIPMYGINTSFNVWGTTAIVAYKILEKL